MATQKLKEKVKANYQKNPKTVKGLGVLGLAVIAGVVGSLTGVVEPAYAAQKVIALVSYLSLGA